MNMMNKHKYCLISRDAHIELYDVRTHQLSLLRVLDPVLCEHFCELTLKHQETHGCVVSPAATDALVLKHQVISTLNAD